MRTKMLAAMVGIIAVLGMAASAQAAGVWTNTPHNVAKILEQRWKTSDGERIDVALCKGIWSSAHQRTDRGEEFHRLRCGEADDLSRGFAVAVTVTGPRFQLRVTQVNCDDSKSEYRCPR